MGLISDQIFEVRKNSYSIFNHTSWVLKYKSIYFVTFFYMFLYYVMSNYLCCRM
jgi:hypothetical protein